MITKLYIAHNDEKSIDPVRYEICSEMLDIFIDISFFIEFIDPEINCLKSALLSDIENQKNSIDISIVNWCDCSETLMACRIPQLYLYRFVII